MYCVTACAVGLLLVGAASLLRCSPVPHFLSHARISQHSTSHSSMSMLGCPGPAEYPQPRLEPWNVAYADRLATEVREADEAQVLSDICPGRATRYLVLLLLNVDQTGQLLRGLTSCSMATQLPSPGGGQTRINPHLVVWVFLRSSSATSAQARDAVHRCLP